MKKQFLRSMLLACMLVITLLPTMALAEEGHTHLLCQTANCTLDHNGNEEGTGHSDADKVNFVKWTDTLAAEQNGNGKTAANSLPNRAGNYYLTADVTLSNTWTVSGGVTLCLNGHSITRGTGAQGSTTITVASGGSLTITDCGANVRQGYIDANYLWNAGETVPVGDTKCDLTGGIINSDKSGYYGGEYVVSIEGGAFTLYGGNLSGSKCEPVSIASNGKFTMNGGNITGNGKKGVNNSGTFTMNGGTISYNGARGVFVAGGGFTMNNGNITNNIIGSSSDGGGVHVSNGTFTMNGGTISGNKAAGEGGGVYVYNNEFTMNGGTITNNEAAGNGGGVCVSDGKFNMNGGIITGNTTQWNGGGVYFSGDTFNLSGGIITGNYEDSESSAANNVELITNRRITVPNTLSAGTEIGVTARLGRFTSGGAAYVNNFKSDNPAYRVDVVGNDLNLVDPPDYNIRMAADPENGTVQIPDTAGEGTTVTITARPAEGYEVKSITVTKVSDDTTVPVSDDGTFIMPDCPVTVSVTFKSSIVPVTGVTLNKESTTLAVGDTETLTASVLPENATNKAVTWKSSDETVATVDNNGKVTAVAPGTATITATAADGSGVSAACTVTVNAVTYTITKADAENGTVTVNKTTATEGEEVTITATPAENYAVNTVTVKDASNNDVAVTDNGNGTYSFTMPAKAVTVSVTFRLLIHQHILCQTNGCTLDHNGDANGVGHDAVHFVPVSTQAELQYYATNGGSVYLTGNIELSSTITVASRKTLNLCLNGCKITPAQGFTGRAVYVSGTLNLTDCGTTGAITGFTLVDSGGASVFVIGTFIMYDGTISNNTETQGWGGGGVYVRYDGTFAMYGGTISGNTTSGSGGGVAGTVTMTGGCIENNTATNGGNSVSGSLKISGSPEISGDVHLGSSGKITITGPLDLPDEYKTISVYSSKDEQHVAITAGASTNGVITNGTQSIFVPKDTVNTRFHVHDGEVCQESTPTVTFDPKGGSPTPVTQTLPFENGKATKPAENPTRDGHLFSHWCDNESCTDYTTCSGWNFNTVITESKTLYAIWEPFSVTVTSGPGKLTAVASPSPEEPADDAYQWYKVVERDTGFTVTPEFLDDGNGINRYGTYSDSKWMTNQDYFNRRFMIYMNSGDTLTMTFDSAPGTMLMYGCNLGTFTSVAQSGESNTYVFTAPSGDNDTTTRDIYVLLFFGDAPAMSAVYNGTAFEAVEDQDDDNASLNTAGLPSGQYVCKVTWAEPTQDNYAGIYALSAPVSYTATYTITKADTSNGIVSVDKSTAAEGETVTITATPDSGYEVDTVTVTKAGGGAVTVTDNTFTMPAEAVTVSVTFKAIPAPAPDHSDDYDPTYPVVENKGEEPDGTVKFSSNYSTPGSTVTVTVTPDKHYGVEKVIVRSANGKEIETTKNADGTYSFKMPYGKVTVEAVYVWENPFVDVEEDTFYIDAVEWALKNGITEGTSETTFSPVASCTRAQMVTFLWRAAGCPEPSGDVCAFTDVNMDSYYGKAVLWAVENGITNGTSETAFSPDMECSRAQMATFLCRMAGGKAESDENAFIDVKADAYYADSVQWAFENGITEGTGEGMYSPDAVCTRGQMVTFLYRYFVD